MSNLEERIPEGDTPPEVDVWAEQAEANWSEQPNSDAGLAPATKRRLGLEGRPE